MAVGFTYSDGWLCCDGERIDELCAKVPTPFYLYSLESIDHQVEQLRSYCGKGTKICYAMKANSNLTILRHLAKKGLGVDAVSGYEIRKAMLAGISAHDIVFSGVGKTAEELALAMDVGVGWINVESSDELHLINKIASSTGQKIKVALRLNPEIGQVSHPKISTASSHSKFGIDLNQAAQLLLQPFSHLQINGVSVHIGSQINDINFFTSAFTSISNFVAEMQNRGATINSIDFGGGIGISESGAASLDISTYGRLIADLSKSINCQCIIEPGRFVVARSGALISSVLYHKTISGNHYTVIDASMSELMRPALYGAQHRISPLRSDHEQVESSLVGPVCESSDVFLPTTSLPKLSQGAQLCIMDAGAYGMSMANNYNIRPLPAEYTIISGKLIMIKARQTFAQLIENELCWQH